MPEQPTTAAAAACTRVSVSRSCDTSAANLQSLSPSEIRRSVSIGATAARGVLARALGAPAPQRTSNTASVLESGTLLKATGRA